MSSNTLKIGQTLDGKALRLDREQLIAGKALITAASGGGKSMLLRKLLEQCGKTTQTIVLDWEGEFASLREKLDIAIVGPGGELPVDVRSAGLLARRLMEKEISAVIDLSDLKFKPRQEFVRRFAEEMVELPKSLWHDVFIAIDEAQMLCPESGQGESESTDAIVNLCTVGRKRGFGVIAATLRLGIFNKTAAAQLLNKFMGQSNLDLDVKRQAFDLGVTVKQAKQMLEPVNRHQKDAGTGLRPGDFYAMGPAVMVPGVTKCRADLPETTHPKRGQGRNLTPPKPSSTITAVVAELADLPKEAEQEIRDLSAAQQKIAELNRELKKTHKPADEKQIEQLKSSTAASVRRPLEQQIKQLRQGLEMAMKVIAKIEATGFDKTGVTNEEIEKALAAAKAQIVKLVEQKLAKTAADYEKFKGEARKALNQLQKLIDTDVNVAVSVKHNEPFSVTAESMSMRPAHAPRVYSGAAALPDDAPEWMRPAHKRLLDAIAWLESMGRDRWDRSIVAAMAGVSPRSSSFGNDLSRISAEKMITYPSPGEVSLTDEGRKFAKAPESPPTLEELHQKWRQCPALDPAHVRLIECLIAQHPESMTREELAEAAGVSPNSSSFGNNVSRLSALGLAKYPDRGRVAAGELLFPEGLS